MTSLSLRAARAAFSVADHIAPRLTARIAFEVFCRTSSPKRLSDRERQTIEATAGFMQEARHHRLRSRRAAFVAHEFRPRNWRHDGATVLVIHGWNSRTEHMRLVIRSLMEAGLRVVALDMPGNGWSPGRKNNMALAVEAASLVAEWFGPFRAIVGHSFGGAVAVNAFVGSVAGVAPVATERLALISAPSSMPALFEDFGRFLSLGTRTQTAMADLVERIAGRPLADYVAADLLTQKPVETLVAHAPDDKEVGYDSARSFALSGSHVRVIKAPGLGHRRILADAGIARSIASFVASGHERRGARQAA